MMYNKLDFCSTEFLLVTYTLLLLGFGAEYNQRYLIYINSYLKSQVNLLFLGLLVIIYCQQFAPVANIDTFDGFFSCNFNVELQVVGLSALIFIASQVYLQNLSGSRINSFEFFTLLLLSFLGLLILARSVDLLLIYLGLELSSFCFYIFTTYNRNSTYATEAGLKYFLLGAVASGMFLLATVFFYASCGTTNYQLIKALTLALNPYSGELLLQQLALLFLLFTLLFKLAVFPFHVWAVDVYSGGPVPSSMFLSTAPKPSFLIFLITTLVFVGGPHLRIWQTAILFSGISSILWSSLAGIKQKRLKRLLAVSSVGNVGFSLVAISTGTLQGIFSGLFYITTYLLATVICWLLLISYNSGKDPVITPNFISFRSLFIKRPITAYITAITFLSFAGIPPLLGFLSKYQVFLTMINASLFSWSFIIFILTIFSTFYYLRVVKIIFFEPCYDYLDKISFNFGLSWTLGWLFTLFVFFSFWPQQLYLLHVFFGLNLIV